MSKFVYDGSRGEYVFAFPLEGGLWGTGWSDYVDVQGVGVLLPPIVGSLGVGSLDVSTGVFGCFGVVFYQRVGGLNKVLKGMGCGVCIGFGGQKDESL